MERCTHIILCKFISVKVGDFWHVFRFLPPIKLISRIWLKHCRKISKYNAKLVATHTKSIPLTHTYTRPRTFSWLRTDNSIKRCEGKLVVWTITITISQWRPYISGPWSLSGRLRVSLNKQQQQCNIQQDPNGGARCDGVESLKMDYIVSPFPPATRSG
jgi:hypothetical protein